MFFKLYTLRRSRLQISW